MPFCSLSKCTPAARDEGRRERGREPVRREKRQNPSSSSQSEHGGGSAKGKAKRSQKGKKAFQRCSTYVGAR